MKTATLRDVCTLITDGTHYTPPNVGSGYPFLTVKDMTDETLDFSGCSHISEEQFQAIVAGNSAPIRGDVLFSKDGTVGKVHVVETDIRFGVLSSIAILRPKSNFVDSQYLGYALRLERTLAQAVRSKTGSAIRRIILNDLARITVPLPPIEEQRRIAAILAKTDTLRAKRRQAQTYLDVLAQSTFSAMFEASTSKNTEHVLLSECSEIIGGATPSTALKHYWGKSIHWATPKDLSSLDGIYFEGSQRGITEDGLASCSAQMLPIDSVLFSSRAPIGLVAITKVHTATNQGLRV